MIRSETIFIRGWPPVSVAREHSWQNAAYGDGWLSAFSRAFICPQCLQQWAILHFEGDSEYVLTPAFCAAHRPAEPHWTLGVPGSILHEEALGVIDRPLLAALPTDLLRHEATLHLNEALKEIAI